MKTSVKALIIAFLFISCETKRHGIELSDFRINGKKYNRLIENRIPDYGDGHPDGCIVKPQISINLEAYYRDTLSGFVFDSKTNDPLSFARVHLFQENPDISTIFITDNLGRFYAGIKPKPIKIRVEYTGYRTFSALLKIKGI